MACTACVLHLRPASFPRNGFQKLLEKFDAQAVVALWIKQPPQRVGKPTFVERVSESDLVRAAMFGGSLKEGLGSLDNR